MIIVTGASRGLGKAISERLTQKGEKVIGLVRSKEGCEFEAIECNVASYASVKNASKEIKGMKETIKSFIKKLLDPSPSNTPKDIREPKSNFWSFPTNKMYYL